MAEMVNDPFAPNRELIINGVTMNDAFMQLVGDIQVEDESDVISAITFPIEYNRPVVYSTGAGEGVNEDIMSMKLLSPGNLVIVRAGYGSDLVEVGAGYITEVQPDFTENGNPTLQIVCYDQLHKLSITKAETGEVFKDYKDSDIVSLIGQRNGFVTNTTDVGAGFGIKLTNQTKVRTLKRGSSHLEFIKELAKLNNYDVYCKWDSKAKKFNLFFEPCKDRTQHTMTYVYGDGETPYNATARDNEIVGVLKSFKPTYSISAQFTKYKVFSWNKRTEKKIEYVLSMDEFIEGQEDLKLGGANADSLLKSKTAATSGAGVRSKAFGDVTEVISTRTFNDEKEAKEYLTNHMKKLAKDFITGTGRVNGNQYLQSRQVLKFKGLGPTFSGNYFVKKVTHTIGSNGYDCDLSVRKVIKENY